MNLIYSPVYIPVSGHSTGTSSVMIIKGQKDMTFQKYTTLSVFIMIMYNDTSGKIIMPPDFTFRFT